MKKTLSVIEHGIYRLSRFTSLIFVALLAILGVYAFFVRLNVASDFQASSKIKINELNLEKSQTVSEQDSFNREAPRIPVDDPSLLPTSLIALLQESGRDSDEIKKQFNDIIGEYSDVEIKLIHKDLNAFIPILKNYDLNNAQIHYKLINTYFKRLVFPRNSNDFTPEKLPKNLSSFLDEASKAYNQEAQKKKENRKIESVVNPNSVAVITPYDLEKKMWVRQYAITGYNELIYNLLIKIQHLDSSKHAEALKEISKIAEKAKKNGLNYDEIINVIFNQYWDMKFEKVEEAQTDQLYDFTSNTFLLYLLTAVVVTITLTSSLLALLSIERNLRKSSNEVAIHPEN